MFVKTKKFASLALLVCASSLTVACGGHGPNSYLMPKDAVVAKLSAAERTFSYGGSDSRKIEATGVNGDTVRLRLTANGGDMPTTICEARVEAIDEEWTRVTPVCEESDSAVENTVMEILEMHVDEFVIAVLYDREIDESMVLKRTSAVAIDNIGEIGREARELSEEMEREGGNRQYSQDGSDWGDNSGGAGWGG